MTETETSNEPIEAPNGAISKRNHILLRIVLLTCLAALLVFAYWYVYIAGYEYTQDAYVGGNMISISPKVTGTVVSYYCDDNDLVEEGQLLAELDPTDYKIAFEAQKAALASAVRQVVHLQQSAKQLEASLSAKKILLKRAQEDYGNRSGLANTRAISKEDLEHAKAEFDFATYQYMATFHELEGTLSLLGTTPLQEHPQVKAAKENLRAAYIHLKRCRVSAPAAGFVAKRSVQVGEHANPAKPMMQIIPLHDLWVDANYKEDQLRNIRIGQEATVVTDLYGSSVVYHGKVQGIQAGTGSVFSLLPPQNATGNWIKIVQRVPVRITLDPKALRDFPLRLGLSAATSVDISKQTGHFLRQEPAREQIARTTAYDISMDEANTLIEEIIRANSSPLGGPEGSS